GWDDDEIALALTSGAAGTDDSRYVAAWADIGRRLRRSRSASWLERLGVTMRQWMENAKVETGLARAFKRASCPEFCTAFDCRTVSIGMYPTFHLIEHAEGRELPASFHDHPVSTTTCPHVPYPSEHVADVDVEAVRLVGRRVRGVEA